MIVGIGPAATDYYYRMIISEMRQRGKDLQLTMVHADAPTLLGNQTTENTTAQVRIYLELAHRLKAAGAQCIAITSIAGHFCSEAFSKTSPLPIIDMIGAVKTQLRSKKYERVGLIGTKGVMQTRFYGFLQDFDVVAPEDEMLHLVHDAYASMAASGRVTDAQRATFFEAGAGLVSKQAVEAVLLAGTDLVLAFKGHNPGFAYLDCAEAHAKTIVDMACA
jgi:aspartate racemase